MVMHIVLRHGSKIHFPNVPPRRDSSRAGHTIIVTVKFVVLTFLRPRQILIVPTGPTLLVPAFNSNF